MKYDIQDLNSSQQCCWRFKSSKVWHSGTGREVSSVLEGL